VVGPGHAYRGQELASAFDVNQGQDLFNFAEESKGKERERKRKKKERGERGEKKRTKEGETREETP